MAKDYNIKLTFYVNSGDEKDMFKPLQQKFQLDKVTWKENTSILRPTFSFHKFKQRDPQTGKETQLWKNFNYVKMEWSGLKSRYYFVRDLRVCLGGIIEIDCEEDYRFTWVGDVLDQRLMIARNEFVRNRIIEDTRAVLPMTRQIDTYTFNDAPGGSVVGDGGDGTIILTVSSGV